MIIIPFHFTSESDVYYALAYAGFFFTKIVVKSLALQGTFEG